MTEPEDIPPFRYAAALAGRIERAWQDRWEREGTFHAPNPVGSLGDGFEQVLDHLETQGRGGMEPGSERGSVDHADRPGCRRQVGRLDQQRSRPESRQAQSPY